MIFAYLLLALVVNALAGCCVLGWLDRDGELLAGCRKAGCVRIVTQFWCFVVLYHVYLVQKDAKNG